MKQLLLVEDDASLGATLQERLVREGYETRWVTTQASAQAALGQSWWDLVILDVGLPDGSGFDLARQIKAQTLLPIIFITAWSSAEKRLEGFEIGAEEFIPKPFHLRELLLRVKRVLNNHALQQELSCNGRLIDFVTRTIVQPDGQRDLLPVREFQLLQLLIAAAPRVVSRDQILDVLWGTDKFPNTRSIDNLVVRLRQSLGDAEATIIQSVRSVGYQWNL